MQWIQAFRILLSVGDFQSNDQLNMNILLQATQAREKGGWVR